MKETATQEFNRAARLLPSSLRAAVLQLPTAVAAKVEEIRLRAGQKPSAVVGDVEINILPEYRVKPSDLQLVLEIATRASVHSYADNIRMGFVSAEGGCRLGLCGIAATENGRVTALRRLSSVCIRIPHEKKGCADTVFERLVGEGFESTIIVSPPGGGKTTLLRELVRKLSEFGKRVCLVDERNEVAGTFEGESCFDLGEKTDILTGAPKAEGVFMLLRSMAPQIIAFDEISSPADIEAVQLSANCGVKLLVTAHGNGIEDLKGRTLYRRLLEGGIFRRAVIIENNEGIRNYKVEELM